MINMRLSLLFMLFASIAFAQLKPTLPPSSNFDLSAWKLQTLDSNNKFTEALPAQLSKGYQSQYFYTDAADGSMVLKTPANGEATSSATHPRVELRQISNGANWKLFDTVLHSLTAQCKVMKTAPDTPKIVIGQIHGSEKVSQLLKLTWVGNKSGKCFVQANFKNNNAVKKDYTLKVVENLSLGDEVHYNIIMKNGTITVTVNGKSCSHTYTEEYFGTADKYYFKAGNYLQFRGVDADVYGLVKFYKLKIG